MAGERAIDRVAAGLDAGLAYCVVLFEPDFTIAWVSPVVTQLGGWAPEELVGRSALELVHPDDLEAMATIIEAETAQPSPFGSDPANLATNRVRLRTKDGGWRTFDVAANNQTGNPDCRGIVVVLRDMTEAGLQAEVLRRLAEGAPLPEVLGAVVDLLAGQIAGAEVRITAANAAGWLVRAATPGTVDGAPSVSVPVAGARHPATVGVWLPADAPVTEWCRMLVARAAEMVHLALVRDVGETELREAARTDSLTGAANHAGLTAHLERVSTAARTGHHAVLYVDLDDFKQVNDTISHDAGNRVLVEVARRLRRCVRPTDLVARPGGDEFVVVCHGLADAELGEAVATRVLEALALPHDLTEGPVVCTATVGLAVTDEAAEVSALLGRADEALLAAKRAGKQRLGRWTAPPD